MRLCRYASKSRNPAAVKSGSKGERGSQMVPPHYEKADVIEGAQNHLLKIRAVTTTVSRDCHSRCW